MLRAERHHVRLAAGEEHPPQVGLVARVGDDADVAGVQEGERQVEDPLLGADQGEELSGGPAPRRSAAPSSAAIAWRNAGSPSWKA